MNQFDISIVLAADTADRIALVIDCVRKAVLERSVEIVVVTPDPASFSAGDDLRVVAVPSLYPLSESRASGIRASSAPRVFIGETHSFPRRGMFDVLVDAHETGATIAVPAFENENPLSSLSWVGLINGYSPWTSSRLRGEIQYAPLFNVSYDRQFLLRLSDELGSILTSGENMLARVRAAGGRIAFDPAARIGHVNIIDTGAWARQRVIAGRVIASVRGEGWSAVRRFAYAIAFPIIPLVLLYRHRHAISQTIHANALSPAIWPVLWLGMAFQAVGEFLGYALGRNREWERRYDEFEIGQMQYG